MSSNKTRLYIYYSTIFFLSLTAFYTFHRITSKHPENYLYLEKCILCGISSFFNMFVLYFHFTHAPHPKFVMLKRRKFAIYTHIASGVFEFISCWLAFLTGNIYIAKFAALTAILAHVPSAYYQTSIVFGAKALMVSGYLFAISLHLFSAINFYLNPTSIYWLLNMFLVHNIYVWCRVFYFFFGYVGIFKDTIYTNSILVSGLILFPAVLSVASNLLFFGYVAASILLYFVIVQPDEKSRARFVSESTRELLVDTNMHVQWIKDQARLMAFHEQDQLTEKQKAKQVFDSLDTNQNGSIDQSEINELLKQWKTAEAFLKRFHRWSKTNDVTFEDFYKHIWRLSETGTRYVQERQLKENKEKARFVFNCLNTNADDFLDSSEIQKLLIQWGLPDNEVDAYLENDDDKQYSFEEFYQNMKPVWEFAYENMIVTNIGQLNTPIHPHSN